MGEKFVGVSFCGLNGGLVLMVVTNLFAGGVFQRLDVLQHGYWNARRPEFVAPGLMHTIECCACQRTRCSSAGAWCPWFSPPG